MLQGASNDPPVVLLVEDELLVRMTAADELEDAGFQVLEARSDEVLVLFTAVHMPGSISGMELAEQVHPRWPHVRILISSGYARPHQDEIPDDGRFMPKPYHATTLVRHVHELVGAEE
jgi:CheY-like chemotaxis protein